MSRAGAQHAGMAQPRTGFQETLAALGSAQKPAAAGAPPYSIFVNRRAGRFVAAAAYRAGMTPNQVTAISATLTFGGIILLAVAAPAWWVGALVWAALALGYIFDSADGQLARLQGSGSVAGEWLDHVVDSTKIVSLHLAVLIAAFRHFQLPSAGWLLVPIGYAIVGTVSFFAMILNDQLKAVVLLKSGRAATPRRSSAIKSVFLIPTDYGVLCLVFLLLGAPLAFFTVYSLFCALNAMHLAVASTRWFGDMRSLSTAKLVPARSES